ncbi:tRNA (N6-isopentenyl adenosine(37)-C2)-methylthiotransferase MiaB [Calycomorphotria hydatis]|uniref:tRNA-2-methylthio-N(6)-dimethylallyladenosine synthase n=1 Tax=Calycomorphotria hydatis TaxID=2528027 RepID=A0A517T811_9PLAN|nr:tRNA (N6-isopentenyl adenosine(37)-C2)-methylthiotransferase MiaB [Calycomorphotria hydatis]QDT64490.1 tRNA-2-methylthio-N(6)-dimethylallyladenosine synthase [Calycomorphotria hydatis]
MTTQLSQPENAVAAPVGNGQLYIETVGCQMNVLDSELVVGALKKQGYELTGEIDDADTILFNTCSVREHAEHKIYSQLGRLKYAKRNRPQLVIGVFGCMAQKDQNVIFQRAPHVDLIAGTGQLAEIPKLIGKARDTRRKQRALSLGRKEGNRKVVAGSFESYDPLREPQMRPSPWQAYVRIMIGCDKFCTYCVVPMTRGPEQGRAPSQIQSEVRVLAGQGVKEITLLGQTVNSYKFEEDGKLYRLADLLHLIHDTEGIERIRFITNYPRDMGNDLLEAIRDLPKCMHYLHVPLQAGCNDVLKSMKRGYTVEQYREMMQRINEIVPGCSVSSDFIVGHPGESEESFQKSMDSVREHRFKNSFIFKYSPRPGTKAFDLLKDDVPEDVKKRRNNELLDLQNAISEEDNAKFIGREVEVLVEGISKNEAKQAENGASSDGPTQLTGRSRCDRIVVFDGNPRLAGTMTRVAVQDCTATTLIGSIVTKQVQHGSSCELPILS